MFDGITKRGSEYLAKCQATGEGIKLVKVKIGDGKISDDEDPSTFTNIKAIKGDYVLDNNNNLYTLQQDEKSNLILKKYDYMSNFGKMIKDIMNNNNIDKLLNIYDDYSKKEMYALVLKNDNNLYKLIYKIKGVYPDEYIELEKEELYSQEFANLLNSYKEDGKYPENWLYWGIRRRRIPNF